MPTLHIEHPITDFGAWSSAFGRFAEARRQAGVRAQRVQRPVGDPRYVVIDLDFGTRGEAEAFLRFLKAQVWGIPGNAPALAGSPQTMITREWCSSEDALARRTGGSPDVFAMGDGGLLPQAGPGR
jgi:hypothetical protein